MKEQLESQLNGRKLKEVCIAAAGRVLKTAVGKANYDFQDTTVVSQEYIHSLEMIGVKLHMKRCLRITIRMSNSSALAIR